MSIINLDGFLHNFIMVKCKMGPLGLSKKSDSGHQPALAASSWPWIFVCVCHNRYKLCVPPYFIFFCPRFFADYQFVEMRSFFNSPNDIRIPFYPTTKENRNPRALAMSINVESCMSVCPCSRDEIYSRFLPIRSPSCC